jgi:hypothetical protein
METELQDWQKYILEMEGHDWAINSFLEKEEDRLYLTETQMKMLTKVLGGDFHISSVGDMRVLEAVLGLGFYFERDKKLLNKVRKSFLEGKNWIK